MARNKKNKLSSSDELEEAIEDIKKKFGEGALMKLNETKPAKVGVIPTGSISLNLALGVKGMPRGRVIEIFGKEATGKTTLALHCIAESQKQGGTAAFIDAEHALDPDYAKRIGVDFGNLLISQPDSGEQALQIVERLVTSGQVDIIVIDSVAALTPKAEIAGEIGDQHIGLQARLMSQALRKLSGIISKTKTVVIFLNQIRMKIGIPFGNPETTPGGLALKFYASVRINLRRIAQIKRGDKIVGSRIKAKVVKNKVAAPFKVAEFDIYYNEGISWTSDLINTGLKYNVLKRTGNSYIFNGKRLGVGMDATKKALKESKALSKEIEKQILDAYEKESD